MRRCECRRCHQHGSTSRNRRIPKAMVRLVGVQPAHIDGQFRNRAMIVPNIATWTIVSIKEMKACGGTFGSAISFLLLRSAHAGDDELDGYHHRKGAGGCRQAGRGVANTYVIYLATTAHGCSAPAASLIDNMYIHKRGRSKGTANESGVRVSMAIGDRRIPAGSKKRRADPWRGSVAPPS